MQEVHSMANRADLYLPLFVAGRDFADHVTDQLGTVADQAVIVDATGLRSGTSSFAAQFVHRILVDGKASELTVVGAPQEFVGYLTDEAQRAGVADRLKTSRHFPEPARR
jgi:hypothetical protein